MEEDHPEHVDDHAKDKPQHQGSPPASPPAPAALKRAVSVVVVVPEPAAAAAPVAAAAAAEADAKVTAQAPKVDHAHEEPKKISEPPKRPPPSHPEAVRIQAWWRGILVRRSLLFAALGALTIQRWWKQLRLRALEARRRAMLEAFTRKEGAAVRLQAWVRMWRTRLRYCRLLHAARTIQAHWRDHTCSSRGFITGHYRVAANQLHLELEIVLGSEPCIVSECIPLPVKQ